MVERPPASAPSATRPPRQGAMPSAESDHHTARISIQDRSALPGWLWGMLGCLSVLGVGFAVLFLVMKPGAAPAVPAAVIAAPAMNVAPSPPARAGGIQVEPMAAPAPPPVVAPTPRPRPAVRAVKVARSQGAGRPAESASAAENTDEDTEDEEAPPPPKTKTASREKAAAAPAPDESEDK